MEMDYTSWRSELYSHTKARLQTIAASGESLSQLNEEGVYHKIPIKHAGVVTEAVASGVPVPDDWPCRGMFPGIWCALYKPTNTYSMAVPGTFRILRAYFQPGVFAFDPRRAEHQAQWEAWWSLPTNSSKPNDAAWLVSTPTQVSLEAKLTRGHGILGITLWPPMPHHASFYREHNYAAFVGYSDYIGLVIINTAAVEHFEVVV
jgi:hypothetical protein